MRKLDSYHHSLYITDLMKNTKKYRPWTPAEEDRLRMLYPIRQNAVLAKLFSRSVDSIKKKARDLGLEKDYGGEYIRPHYIPENVWTDREIKELKHLYPRKTADEIAERLGRTRNAILTKAKKLGLQKDRNWRQREVDCLQRHYTKKGSEYVAEQLSRTPDSVRQKASKLGINREEKIVWTPENDRLLEQLYFKLPVEQVAKRLDRSVSSVKNRAWSLRLIKQVRWTEEAEEQLRQLYLTHSYSQIAEIMDRPFEAVKAKGKRLGLQTKQNRKQLASIKIRTGINKDKPVKLGRWTKEEERLLRQLYPDCTYDKIAEIMRRPSDAIKTKSKRLGLS